MGKKKVLIVVCAAVLGVLVVFLMMPKKPMTEPPQTAQLPGTKAAEPADTNRIKPITPITPAVAVVPKPVRPDIQTQLAGLEISPGVKILIGLDKEHLSDKDRRVALRKLTRKIPADDVKALRVFLDTRLGDQRALDPMTFNALKNDVLDVLLRQDKVPEAMGAQLAGMFRDTEHDAVWRDYCVQYMAPYYEARWPAGAKGEDDAERKEVDTAYWEALDRKEASFAGTALLGIERLSRDRQDLNRTNIADKAVALAIDETAIEANRITAFRVAALMQKTEVLPSARIAAQTGATGPLRMAAIATIGDLGGPADRELLQSFAASSEKRIKGIAEAALKKLDARQAAAVNKP